jgi:hypothetical protein
VQKSPPIARSENYKYRQNSKDAGRDAFHVNITSPPKTTVFLESVSSAARIAHLSRLPNQVDQASHNSSFTQSVTPLANSSTELFAASTASLAPSPALVTNAESLA